MQIKVNKKTATITLENADEIEGVATLLAHYMDMVWEEADPGYGNEPCHPDRVAERLDKKFNPATSIVPR